MVRISYYLDKPTAEKSIIRMTVSLKGRSLIFLKETVDVKSWDSAKQRLKVRKGQDEHERINARLDKYSSWAKDIYHRMMDDSASPDHKVIAEKLSVRISGKTPKPTTLDFFQFVESYISQQKKIRATDGKKGTIVTLYIQTKRLMEAYEQERKVKLTYSNMDINFYADLIEYMGMKRGFSINTAGEHIKRIRKFLRLSRKAKHHDFDHYEGFAKMEADVDVIALSEAEIDLIGKVKLKDKGLETQRDLFLVGCYTGLRYSDYGTLKKERFIDGMIYREQKKTGNQVVIPIHPKLKPILEKYDYDLPPVYENQTVNEYLKKIGEEAKINQVIHWREFKLKGIIEHTSPKYKLITTHTARRSFCTNVYLSGFPVHEIMRISGHKTERDFFRYIRMAPNDSAEMLKKHWGG